MKNTDPNFNKESAFQDLKKIVDEIYVLKEKAKKYDDKETPKKPDTYKRHKKLPINYFCPNCQKNLYSGQKHCDECGIAIDWSDEVCQTN